MVTLSRLPGHGDGAPDDAVRALLAAAAAPWSGETPGEAEALAAFRDAAGTPTPAGSRPEPRPEAQPETPSAPRRRGLRAVAVTTTGLVAFGAAGVGAAAAGSLPAPAQDAVADWLAEVGIHAPHADATGGGPDAPPRPAPSAVGAPSASEDRPAPLVEATPERPAAGPAGRSEGPGEGSAGGGGPADRSPANGLDRADEPEGPERAVGPRRGAAPGLRVAATAPAPAAPGRARGLADRAAPPADAAAHGKRVSAVARDAATTGRDKGAAVSAVASGRSESSRGRPDTRPRRGAAGPPLDLPPLSGLADLPDQSVLADPLAPSQLPPAAQDGPRRVER